MEAVPVTGLEVEREAPGRPSREIPKLSMPGVSQPTLQKPAEAGPCLPGTDEPIAPTHWSFGQLSSFVGAACHQILFDCICRPARVRPPRHVTSTD